MHITIIAENISFHALYEKCGLQSNLKSFSSCLTRSIPGLRIGLLICQTFPTGMFFGNCPQKFHTLTGHL